MRIAVIADIHSNIFSLNEVLLDIDNRNIDLVVCMGDLVGYATYPNEVINTIRENKILTIKGNYDEAVGEELMICGCDYPDPKDAENAGLSLNWTIDETSDDNKEFLKSLPKEVKMTFEGRTILFVHGSPRRINEYLKENSTEAEEVMRDFEADILVCGHTHKPYFKMYGNKMLVNAGSAGKPKTGNPKANYVVIDLKDETINVEIHEVEYDFEQTAMAIEANGLPKEFAEIIRTGKA
ncbi:MAG: YfcE family phosphodiesterase [Clostridiales bacterium GWB2_37_7]|nr:MAG: YfcE family phosphodiesterase [Clostridiales bacterium GWB2_37_7]